MPCYLGIRDLPTATFRLILTQSDWSENYLQVQTSLMSLSEYYLSFCFPAKYFKRRSSQLRYNRLTATSCFSLINSHHDTFLLIHIYISMIPRIVISYFQWSGNTTINIIPVFSKCLVTRVIGDTIDGDISIIWEQCELQSEWHENYLLVQTTLMALSEYSSNFCFRQCRLWHLEK